jgi:hypothetical protein
VVGRRPGGFGPFGRVRVCGQLTSGELGRLGVCSVGHGGLHGLVDAMLVYEVASIGAGRHGRE